MEKVQETSGDVADATKAGCENAEDAVPGLVEDVNNFHNKRDKSVMAGKALF